MLKKSNFNLNDKTRLKQPIANKKVIYGLTLVILILFWDTLIPAIWHILYVPLEIVNSIIEHFLEHTFHVSPRQSELMVFWGGMAINAWILTYVLRKGYINTVRLYEEAKMRWILMQSTQKFKAYIQAAILLSMMGLTFFLLT